jgi:dGTPase
MDVWKTLLSTERLRPPDEEPRPGDELNHFVSDYYRVVFSSAFRRLQDKTQVSPLATDDFVRRRLTHSVEVAAVGERMGRVVGKRLHDEEGVDIAHDVVGKLVATACLLHDIGNPPFGHEGECAIRKWADSKAKNFRDYQGFDGNAHGFRLATRLQHHGLVDSNTA